MSVNFYHPQELQSWLSKNGLALTKARGQNFLLDQKILSHMASLLPEQSEVLEIGPGLGHLTRFLSKRTANLTLIEFDQGFIEHLTALFPSARIIHADFLRTKLSSIGSQDKILIANLPYNITSDVLLKMLKEKAYVKEFYLLLQKEAGEKLMESPGSKKYSRLSVLYQLFAEVKELFPVPSGAFYPAPQVESAFFHFRFTKLPYQSKLVEFVSGLFSNRRKTLSHILRKKYPQANALMENLGMDPGARPETLIPSEFLSLFQALESVTKEE